MSFFVRSFKSYDIAMQELSQWIFNYSGTGFSFVYIPMSCAIKTMGKENIYAGSLTAWKLPWIE